MNFAFVIDNRKCIGCHACSTACKSENSVPLSVNRTWVKYVEKGSFPHVRRFFQVTRCNHCANPPCVPICPTAAMFQRPDGIVEFDGALCIGCKACIQACPYDAIYIDPESHTAAKCHYCAHRTDVGLEPACVVVCPVHAIIAGDMDDPRTEVARLLATERVAVRKPEQNTKPKLFYIEAEESALLPTLAAQDTGYLWGDLPQGGDWRPPIEIAQGRMAGALTRSAAPRETYNVPHRVPWHWQVPAYLVTKAIGCGMFLIAAAGLALGLFPATPLFTTLPAIAALVLMAATSGLLVWDLDRPERFWTMLARPQWRSWLVRGAWILIGVSGLAAATAAAYLLGRPDLARILFLPAVVFSALGAVYTAFLFAQAQGRDLWQSSILPWHMLVQSILAGSAGLLLAGLFLPMPAAAARVLVVTFAASAVAALLMAVGGEFGIPHASLVAAAAARLVTRGRYAPHYRASLVLGLLLPASMVLVAGASAAVVAAAALLAVAGLFLYEWAYVMAPQQIPNN